MFFPIGLAMISLCLKAARDPSVSVTVPLCLHLLGLRLLGYIQVQGQLAEHQDPCDRLKFVTEDLIVSLCQLLHDPTPLLHEVDRCAYQLLNVVGCIVLRMHLRDCRRYVEWIFVFLKLATVFGRWRQHPALQKDNIECAKIEQMALMSARGLMCAASRKHGDGCQMHEMVPDDLPLCAFCHETFDGGGVGCLQHMGVQLL